MGSNVHNSKMEYMWYIHVGQEQATVSPLKITNYKLGSGATEDYNGLNV